MFLCSFYYGQSYARAHAHAYPHTPTHTRTRTHTGSWSKQTEHVRPAVCMPTTWRDVWICAPFLATLSTHCIRRSDPRPPPHSERICACLAAVSVFAGPASHAHPVASSDRPLQHQVTTPTRTRTYSAGACLSPAAGHGVCACRSALSTTEPAEDPSSLSLPHAPMYVHVSRPTALSPSPACGAAGIHRMRAAGNTLG